MDPPKKADSECIQVVVRCRPFNNKEKNEGRTNIISVDTEARQVSISNAAEPDEPPKSFTFDATYDETAQQKAFYEESCFGLVESVLEGFNGTIFAYGQTGCGKSWTMQGPINGPDHLKGVIPNSFGHIFQHIAATSDVEYLVRCSYLEIYNEEIKDLLVDPKLKVPCEIKEDPGKGIFIKGLSDVIVESEADLQAMLDKGAAGRSVAATLMNEVSSRSHSIFTVVIEMSSKDKDTGKDHIRAGKLNLVDLAGSERQKKTGASGAQLKEGIKINLSLSSLGNVISALAENKGKHIPYRDSKLTRLLQDSLGGNTKTLMVAAISPADYNYDETMSTLRYANRAKNIQNKPKVNEDPKDTLLREYKEEIERLRKLLQEQMAGGKLSDALASMDAMSHMLEGGAGSNHAHASTSQHHTVASTSHHHHAAPHSPTHAPPREQSPRESNGAVSLRAPSYTDKLEASGEYSDDFHPENSTKKLPKSPKRPDGPPGSHARDVVVQKEIEYVEVEKIPESYLNEHRALKEKAETIAYERDQAHEQLEQTEEEMAKEKQLREELKDRLLQLQSKLVGKGEDTAVSTKGESFEQQQEREEAEKLFQERKLRAKKRKEARQQQLQRVLNEKQAVEEELEELRRSAATWASSAPDENGEAIDASSLEKKLAKLRKKYDKKILTLKQENDDIREEFNYQKQQLQDALTEQEKDIKLYEQICKSLLRESELKKILERAKWDEDEDAWVLPYVKRKSIDGALPGGGGNGKMLPDIYGPKSLAGYNAGDSDYGGNNNKALPDIFAPQKQTAYNGGGGDMDFLEYGITQQSPRGELNGLGIRGVGMKPVIGSTGVTSSRPGSAAKDLVPMLMLGGGMSNASNLSNGDGIAGQEKKKKKKKKKVKPIVDRLPDTQTDEAGCGESAGAISDWGFAGGGIDSNGIPTDQEPEQEYSDDEDFEDAPAPVAASTIAAVKAPGMPPMASNSKSKGPSTILPIVKVSPRGTALP